MNETECLNNCISVCKNIEGAYILSFFELTLALVGAVAIIVFIIIVLGNRKGAK